MNKKQNKLITIVVSLALSLFLISTAVKLTLAFRQLYSYDVDKLNIAHDYGMKKEVVINNYNILIDYLQKKNIEKLFMPNFPISREGEIHFIEVKALFMKFDIMLYSAALISLIGVIYLIRKKDFKFLKWTSIGSLALPVFLSVPFAINFDSSFTIFHKIFFNNDYWEFDPVKDPIINVLPQEFFFHCAIMILALLTVSSLVMYIIYRKLVKTKRA